MENVILLDGIFKTSQEKGKEYLLYLNPDRLLAPCYEAIGKKPKAKGYGGWEEREISGHSLGHFMSALSYMNKVDKDERLKKKLDYIIEELMYIQSFSADGYVSGFSKECFNRVFSGDFNVTRFELGGGWVPWYSIHKIYAGLIDAYELTKNKKALNIVISMANWAKRGIDNLTEDQFQKMLYCEHGGMCESMARLYEITKNKDYLDLAIRFLHKETLKPLINLKDELEGKHANTQIPKIIGAARLYDITKNEDLKRASEFFWNIVTRDRSYVIGGNSIDEHFGKAETEALGVTTAETCNTYNMLKLTEHLYKWNRDSKYMDYYENALYNHILASQDPVSGMKTYFMSTKPGHFKVYCSLDNSFWCCTGTGMENPTKYTKAIYYRNNNELFVNLYISSKIILEDKNLIISQNTNFPEDKYSTLLVEKGHNEHMIINIRIPYWGKGIKVKINEKEEDYKRKDGYISINRVWNKGDNIDIFLPMNIHLYYSKEDSNKVVFMYGPIVLAGALGRENFPETDILDDHLKLNHYKGIEVSNLESGSKNIIENIKKIDNEKLCFEIQALDNNEKIEYKLKPFYDIHHERYTIYWDIENKDEKEKVDNYKENIIIDEINLNEQQSEIEHGLKYKNSTSDYSIDYSKGWRMCYENGYFSYEMKVHCTKDTYLLVTYLNENIQKNIKGEFFVYVDNFLISEEKFNEDKSNILFNKSYKIPRELIKNKSKITVKFKAKKNTIVNKVFGIKTTKEKF